MLITPCSKHYMFSTCMQVHQEQQCKDFILNKSKLEPADEDRGKEEESPKMNMET